MWNFICEMIPISSKPSSSSMSRSISSTINERKAQAYALLCQFLDCFFLVLPNKENDHLFEFALDLRTCEDFWKIIQVKNSSLSLFLFHSPLFFIPDHFSPLSTNSLITFRLGWWIRVPSSARGAFISWKELSISPTVRV